MPGKISSVNPKQIVQRKVGVSRITSKEDLVKEYSDLLDGELGFFPSGMANLEKDETVRPVRLPLRSTSAQCQ